MKTEPEPHAAPRPRLASAGAPADAVLIARILAGEEEYFKLLIRRYNGTLYKVR